MSEAMPQKIIVLRFSALGDVALSVPVIWSLTNQYPNIEITFVSRNFAKNILERIPNVRFFEIDPTGRHKGFIGVIRLFRDLKKLNTWNGLADLHDVLRTKIIRLLFAVNGIKVASINKGRKQKRMLTRKRNKKLIPLSHTAYRYADVFKGLNLGIDIQLNFKTLVQEPIPLPDAILIQTGFKQGKWIGIAPFAKHRGKAYPLDGMKQVIEVLAGIPSVTIILFGGKGSEQETLEEIAEKYTNVHSIAGRLSLDKELDVMSNLEVMVSMDSANMHLASLVGVSVISIWGATHPNAGFYGWNQHPSNAIQVELECRPCSVFGNKPCFRLDYACLNRINPGDIIGRVVDKININS
jgi:ADP-heptose:LPS heptosyltransferase